MATIESYVQPLNLYRYRPLGTFDQEMDAIEHGYLYCTTSRNLNDPMEGRFASSRKFRSSENYPDDKSAIITQKDQIGICSFSEVYDHEVMWAHYAEQFKGICVAYKFSNLLKHLAGNITFTRMYYSEKTPTVRSGNKQPDELAKMVLSYKNYRWLYEREWRMFAKPGKVPYQDPKCVTHVYLGYRMEDHVRKQITRRLKKLGIETKTTTIKKYVLSFEAATRLKF